MSSNFFVSIPMLIPSAQSANPSYSSITGGVVDWPIYSDMGGQGNQVSLQAGSKFFVQKISCLSQGCPGLRPGNALGNYSFSGSFKLAGGAVAPYTVNLLSDYIVPAYLQSQITPPATSQSLFWRQPLSAFVDCRNLQSIYYDSPFYLILQFTLEGVIG